ncbi:tRNA uracil 4-sulfurtransferase ThiI [Paenibacillus sp. MMS18-CY102]|uniref:tRNA uracil 4-sulfurtransferase ThiI n=1 Tax=Paenibacillus sp. MMS18-CY102 TaxID=2682849 RepID=UPI0013662DDF|nr:tRNA uracil 4-sulfurtransferase ThiI [Paenibacillus sp. MMS18-CY102]MWC27471.1 tRNA 4-thiouridine(8) synthase ThiI [Paenibacillus sp. MMS18-CY102]
MIYDMVLLRLGGEITVKGKNRARFEKVLGDHVRKALRSFENIVVKQTYGRLYVELNAHPYEAVADALRDVFGLVSFSPVKRTDAELDAIQATALDVFRAHGKQPETFKVTVKRGWKQFPHDSMEMNHLVASHVLRETPELKVNIRNPEVELRVDIQKEAAYVYCDTEAGAGGFPYGANGKAMLLLSGGIDSPVAGWLGMRKGLELEAVHFYSYPFTSEQAKEKVVTLAKRLLHFTGGKFKLHLVPFTEIQTRFAQSDQERLIITLMRRAMLRITEIIAARESAHAIVTGDSLGQVASQTLGSMTVIGRVAELPILRPLVMMDKIEIIRIAERIGTYETSILPFEDCCTLFVPKSPSTNPNLSIVESVEAGIDNLDAMIQQAVKDTVTVVMKRETVKAAPEGAEAAATGSNDTRAETDEDRWF